MGKPGKPPLHYEFYGWLFLAVNFINAVVLIFIARNPISLWCAAIAMAAAYGNVTLLLARRERIAMIIACKTIEDLRVYDSVTDQQHLIARLLMIDPARLYRRRRPDV